MGKWRVMDCSNSTGSDSNADKDLPPFGRRRSRRRKRPNLRVEDLNSIFIMYCKSIEARVERCTSMYKSTRGISKEVRLDFLAHVTNC